VEAIMPEQFLSAPKCTRSHTSQVTREGVSHLAISQKSYWRHKCAACAYEAGLAEGKRQALAQAENSGKRR
jgi:hypothetical protein